MAAGMFSTVKKFLVGFSYKELFVFLFFLAVSSVFWVFTTLNEVIERDVRIPVKLVNIPAEVIVTTNVHDTISVSVEDKGFIFFDYEFGKGVQPVEIDFRKYALQSGYGQVNSTELQNLAISRLSSSSKLISMNPTTLEFYYNYGQSRKLPVRVEGNITPDEHYYIDQIKVSPEVVTVYAQQQMLDTMHYVATIDMNEFNFIEDITRTVKLKTLPGVKVVPNKVTVTIHPDILGERQLEVPIVPVNVPDGIMMRTFPTRVTIHYTAGSSALNDINQNDFKVVVDYKDVEHGAVATCNVYIRKMPEQVNNARLDIDQVDFLIESIKSE